jgi:DNA-binding GntR family transcriptional regulator
MNPGSAVYGARPIAEPPSMRHQVHGQLKAMLVSGELAPGQLVSVQQLAELFGVSRTPVREALLQLVREGLLRSERNRGFRVVVSSAKDLDDITAIRLLLEVPAMEQAARLPTEAKGALAHARALCSRMVDAAEAEDLATFVGADTEFHLLLVGLLDNERLTDLVSDLRDHVHLPGLLSFANSGKLAESSQEHLQLLGAIEAGDAERAVTITRKHIQRTRTEWTWQNARRDADREAEAG